MYSAAIIKEYFDGLGYRAPDIFIDLFDKAKVGLA
jgi:hypothetical protein